MSYVTKRKINPKFAANRNPVSIEELQQQFMAVEGLELKLIRDVAGNRIRHGWPWTFGLAETDTVTGLLSRINRYQDYVQEVCRFLVANAHGVIFNVEDLRALAERKTTILQLKEQRP